MAHSTTALQCYLCKSCNYLYYHLDESETNWKVDESVKPAKVVFTPPFKGPRVHYLIPKKTAYVLLHSRGGISTETEGKNFDNLSRIHTCSVEQQFNKPRNEGQKK